MCGRFTVTVDADALAAEFGMNFSDEGTRRFNVAPTQEVIAITADDSGEQTPRLLRWGLIPSWAKDEKIAYKMINARAETVLEKPAYRTLVRAAKHRCLILADGFYEWMKPEDRKAPRQPMRFSLATGRPFAFAGLCTTWYPPEADPVSSATIVTTTANALVAPVHDRMPVMFVDPDTRASWLDPAADAQTAADLLVSLDESLMRVAPANPLVNSARNEGSELLVP